MGKERTLDNHLAILTLFLMKLVSRVKGIVRDLFDFIQMYGQHLPLGIKMIFSIHCSVSLLNGPMRGGQPALTVLYIGRNKNRPYLLKTFYEKFSVLEEKRSTLFTFHKLRDHLESQADVIVMDIGWPYHGLLNRNGNYLEMPDWANMALVLEDTWEGVKRSFHKTIRHNDLRYIRQQGYRCEETVELSALERFYDTMYLPFVNGRHSGDVIKAPRRHVIRQARKGCLQQIIDKNGHVVAAGVIYPQKGILFFLWMGMPEGCIEKPPPAAISALFLYGIQHAFEHDCWAVDFMGMRTFFKDGAFRFKRKWGAVVQDTFSPSSLLIKPQPGNLKAARLCNSFPMMIRRNGELEGLFLSVDEEVDDAFLSRLETLYGCDGLHRMTVIDISGNTEAGSTDCSIQGRAFRLIGADLNTFADHYRNAVTTD